MVDGHRKHETHCGKLHAAMVSEPILKKQNTLKVVDGNKDVTNSCQKENVTKWPSMELAMQEQVKQRQEMENKTQKLRKTKYHFGRAQREEATPLIEVAFQRRLADKQLRHEREQQLEIMKGVQSMRPKEYDQLPS